MPRLKSKTRTQERSFGYCCQSCAGMQCPYLLPGAQRITAHESLRTTKLYDWRGDEGTLLSGLTLIRNSAISCLRSCGRIQRVNELPLRRICPDRMSTCYDVDHHFRRSNDRAITATRGSP